MLSAVLSSFAGSLFAHQQSFISPDSFSFYVSIELLTMVVLGGMASTYGAVFGAVTFAALGEQAMAGSFAAATHLAWWLMVGCGAGLVTLGLRTPRGPLAPTLD